MKNKYQTSLDNIKKLKFWDTDNNDEVFEKVITETNYKKDINVLQEAINKCNKLERSLDIAIEYYEGKRKYQKKAGYSLKKIILNDAEEETKYFLEKNKSDTEEIIFICGFFFSAFVFSMAVFPEIFGIKEPSLIPSLMLIGTGIFILFLLMSFLDKKKSVTSLNKGKENEK